MIIAGLRVVVLAILPNPSALEQAIRNDKTANTRYIINCAQLVDRGLREIRSW